MAVELMGRNISAIYDEEEWYHDISASDHTNRVNNWQLPSSFKKLLWVTLSDLSPDDDIHYSLPIVSPHDQYSIHGTGRTSFNYNSTTPTIRDMATNRGRIDVQSQPHCTWAFNKNLYVFPFPSSDEEGWRITAGLQVLPAAFTDDAESNTISDNYPQALILLAGTIFWGLQQNEPFRFNTWLQMATSALTGVAREQELTKLTNIAIKLNM